MKTKEKAIQPVQYKKSRSAKDLMNKNHEVLELPKPIADLIGEFSIGSSILIFGPPGSGKSTLGMHFVKAFMPHGKCYWNEIEQAMRRSFKMMLLREGLDSEPMARLAFGMADTLEEMKAKIRRNKSKFVFLNSLQYSTLSQDDWKELTHKYATTKSFIIVSHGDKKPDGTVANLIHFDVDVKIRVSEGTAYPDSRLGGNVPYQIFIKDRGQVEKVKPRKALPPIKQQLLLEYQQDQSNKSNGSTHE